MSVNLRNVHGCLDELEACSNGLASLDHLYNQAVDELSEAEQTWETVESEAAKAARADAPSAATATEIKGLITAYINARPSAAKARDQLRDAKDNKEKIERFMRSLEKRGSMAQSAQNGHQVIERFGGRT